MASDNLNDQLYATNLAISDTINNSRDPQIALDHLDTWIPFLQNSNIAALTAIGSDLQQLRDYVRSGDKANTHELLQRLGEQTSRAASNIHTWAGDHLHNGIGDQLRHLGQLLVIVAGNVKASL
ncbi:hypothetical protein [Hymenobacter cavernae]|uniref:Uncharacterized protein n=1 Tax=Hymenobacter cavernae TaxID=2044852 RepID=A0ABQ1TG49_9BACT|nr:hypothetical protein [Hymenobacter cavernae]GGE94000.1 hypothetical protein GCM10011383_00850 [Hymenobacter cavernae]